MHVVQIATGGRFCWYVCLVASSGREISVSERYRSERGARRAARRMFPNFPIRKV